MYQLSPLETVCCVDESFDEPLICGKTRNRQIFSTIFRNIQFLLQCQAFQRSNNEENLEQLIKLNAKIDPRFISWMEKKREKCLHHDMKMKS